MRLDPERALRRAPTPAKQRRAQPAVGLVEKHPGVRNLRNIKTCYHTYKHGGVLLTIS